MKVETREQKNAFSVNVKIETIWRHNERIKNKKQLRKYRSIVSSKVSNTDTTNETFDQFVLGIQRNNGFKVSNANLYQDTLEIVRTFWTRWKSLGVYGWDFWKSWQVLTSKPICLNIYGRYQNLQKSSRRKILRELGQGGNLCSPLEKILGRKIL